MGQIVSTWTSVGTVHKVAYVKLFSANFNPLPLLHFVTHHGTPQKYVPHLGSLPILVGLVQKTWTKALCTNSLSIVRGGFVRGVCMDVKRNCSRGFCPGVCMDVKRNFCRGWDKLSARGLAWGPSIK